MVPFVPPLLLNGRADGLGRAAGFLDLFDRRFRELVRFHGNLARQLASSEDLEAVLQLLDDAQFDQAFHIEGVAFELFEAA